MRKRHWKNLRSCNEIKKLKEIMVLNEECKWYSACPMKRYFEQGRLDRKWIELYCRGDWEACVRFELEEKGITHPDWMLPDGKIDERLREI